VKSKANVTIATTGVLLLLSGAWSLTNLRSPLALFGAPRTGLLVALYNGVFAALLMGMGYALVQRRRWAPRVTWAASLFYTFDKLELILDPAARDVAIGETAAMLGDMAFMVQQVLVLTSVLFLLGWWGFVAYLHFKRDYFAVETNP
jgi:hypothetical protein